MIRRWLERMIHGALLLTASAKCQYHGITVADCSPEGKQSDQFMAAIRAALDLLQQHDSRRFRRVTDNLSFILQFPLISGAQYQECVRACKIDFAHFTQSFRINDEELQAELPEEIQPYLHAILATTLVHEATHGVISARGIPYDEQHRVRIEKRCAREGRLCWRQLASRLDALEDHPELDACFEYDEQWYEDYWQEPAAKKFQHLWQTTCGSTSQQQSETSAQVPTEVATGNDR